jgi:hypothetical protein
MTVLRKFYDREARDDEFEDERNTDNGQMSTKLAWDFKTLSGLQMRLYFHLVLLWWAYLRSICFHRCSSNKN